jgi:hypothetical protein
MGKRERDYQPHVIKEIERRLPGCLIQKLDSNYRQGIPDLLILYYDRWAILEVKKSANEVHQPNQDYYVEQFNGWSFSAFIYPENEEEVLDALQHALLTSCSGVSRLPKC